MGEKIPTFFDLGVISSRAVKLLASLSKTEHAEKFVRMAIADDNSALAYFWETLNNQKFAIETKQQLFLETTKLHGKPIGAWKAAMNNRLPIHDVKIGDQTLLAMIRSRVLLYNASTSLNNGTAHNNMRYSGKPAENGTFIHEILGDQIIKNACRVDPTFRGNEYRFKHILPGRLWSPNFFPIASTPDGITICDEEKFLKLVNIMSSHDPHTPLTEEIKELIERGGAPLYIHEIKTSQVKLGGHRGTGSKIDREEIEDLYTRFNREGPTENFKNHVLSTLLEYCVDAGRTSAVDIARGGYSRRNNDRDIFTNSPPVVKRRKLEGSKKHSFSIADSFHAKKGMFSKTNDIVVRAAYDYETIKELTGDVVPYLCEHSTFKVLDRYSKHFNNDVKPSTSCKKEVSTKAEKYEAKKLLNREGRCVVIFYENTENPIELENKNKFDEVDCQSSEKQVVELFSIEFDFSPFSLSTNGLFKRQCLAQMATMKHLNNELNHIFTLIFSYNTNNNAIPCVQISWVQNIHHEVVDDYVKHTVKKVAEVDPIFNKTLWKYRYEDAVSKTPYGTTMSNYIKWEDSTETVEDEFFV